MLYYFNGFVITFSGEESPPPNQIRVTVLQFSSLDFFTEGTPFLSWFIC